MKSPLSSGTTLFRSWGFCVNVIKAVRNQKSPVLPCFTSSLEKPSMTNSGDSSISPGRSHFTFFEVPDFKIFFDGLKNESSYQIFFSMQFLRRAWKFWRNIFQNSIVPQLVVGSIETGIRDTKLLYAFNDPHFVKKSTYKVDQGWCLP